jgi:hypothetical protein
MPLVILVYLMNYIDRYVEIAAVCLHCADRLLQE